MDEKNRSWCSSSAANDQRAVTIECASDKTAPFAFNDKVYNKLVELCADICKRNGKTKLLWLGDKSTTLNYSPKSEEMVLTVHRWFANKSCPGDWLYNRLGDLADKVNAKLGGVTADVVIDYSTPSDWAKATWEQATKDGITDGTNPKKEVTREQAVTLIYRKIFNRPNITIEEAVSIAKSKGYTDGSNLKDNTTRQQAVTFIYRMKENKPKATLEESWSWGINQKITDGSDPNGHCTREQIVLMLSRL